MPKSKRSRIVHTSRVQKKPAKVNNQVQYTAIQEAADKYENAIVFGVENMRNASLKEVRQHFSDSRMFFGKTKVMAKALGSNVEDEYLPGLAELAGFMRGDVGVVFTDRDAEEVLTHFSEATTMDFARAGVPASITFTVPAGIVYSTAGTQPIEDDVPLPHSMEATVRKWGMPTRLDKGKVMLDDDYVVCKAGKVLDSNQTALLKIFGVPTAEFRVVSKAVWSKETGSVKAVEGGGVEAMDED